MHSSGFSLIQYRDLDGLPSAPDSIAKNNWGPQATSAFPHQKLAETY